MPGYYAVIDRVTGRVYAYLHPAATHLRRELEARGFRIERRCDEHSRGC